MQQFTVPQFIDVEDKVIGPITVRQFVIMLAGGLLIALCYKLFYFTTFIIVAVIIVFIVGILAFAKVNGVHFHLFFLNFLASIFKPNVRVWNNAFGKDELRIESEKVVAEEEMRDLPEKTYNTSRLAELSLVVDTQGVFRGGKTLGQQSTKYDKKIHSREYNQ